MKRNLSLAVLCIIALPFLSLPTTGDRLTQAGSSASIAFAGHQLAGGVLCPCDLPNGVCEFGLERRASEPAAPEGQDIAKGLPPPNAEENADPDLIAAALYLAFGLIIWRYATNSIY